MISNNDFALIAALDLESIKMKLMHKESGEGWSAERTNTTETEYRRFLYLMKAFPHVEAAPLEDVDTFWHYHILDTLKYARDCERAFGYFLHHYPYLGLVGENGLEMLEQAGDRTRELYESTFGVSYVRPQRTDVTLEAADVQAAWGPGVSQAANSAWCASPAQPAAGAMRAGWYGRAPQQGVSQAANSAWCASPARPAEGATHSAWCASPARPAEGATRTAWCASPNIAKAGVKSAWCASPAVVNADAKTAWCASPGVVKAADVQTAWCASPAIHAA
jgi:hypothetical protein